MCLLHFISSLCHSLQLFAFQFHFFCNVLLIFFSCHLLHSNLPFIVEHKTSYPLLQWINNDDPYFRSSGETFFILRKYIGKYFPPCLVLLKMSSSSYYFWQCQYLFPLSLYKTDDDEKFFQIAEYFIQFVFLLSFVYRRNKVGNSLVTNKYFLNKDVFHWW